MSTALLFDLDGTLVDSVADLAESLNAALSQNQLLNVTVEQVATWVGNGTRVLVQRALGSMDAEDHLEQVLADFTSHYAKSSHKASIPLRGAIEALEWAYGEGIPMAVVTNKPEAFAFDVLKAQDLEGFFPVVIGGDTCSTNKPDPEPLQEAMKRLGVTEAIMVGDSKTDVASGKNAGLPVFAVEGGYNHGLPISDSNPDVVLLSLKQLPQAWQQWQQVEAI
ncbi:HAD family hydrolase [Salinibius halmophilus]|uniref:HAD family hydrolase n=1 Tax=Salinibius halmophilus TaxID=1853216 RepID=UPI000E66D7AF|nr:HAD family hydrolase [Salinibius halmophilus]